MSCLGKTEWDEEEVECYYIIFLIKVNNIIQNMK